MAELTNEIREAIVTAHAHFRSPAEIKQMLRDEFDIEVELTQIVRYNPTKACFEGKEAYRELFEARRKAYIEDVSSVPIANQGFRLNELRTLYEKAVKMKNIALAAQLLEQAAKEVGGALTNERVHKSDGRPMQPDQMSPEERRQMAAQIISDALAAKGKTVQEGPSRPQ